MIISRPWHTGELSKYLLTECVSETSCDSLFLPLAHLSPSHHHVNQLGAGRSPLAYLLPIALAWAQSFCLESSTVAWKCGQVSSARASPDQWAGDDRCTPLPGTQWTVLRFTQHCSSAGPAGQALVIHSGDLHGTLPSPYFCSLGSCLELTCKQAPSLLSVPARR